MAAHGNVHRTTMPSPDDSETVVRILSRYPFVLKHLRQGTPVKTRINEPMHRQVERIRRRNEERKRRRERPLRMSEMKKIFDRFSTVLATWGIAKWSDRLMTHVNECDAARR